MLPRVWGSCSAQTIQLECWSPHQFISIIQCQCQPLRHKIALQMASDIILKHCCIETTKIYVLMLALVNLAYVSQDRFLDPTRKMQLRACAPWSIQQNFKLSRIISCCYFALFFHPRHIMNNVGHPIQPLLTQKEGINEKQFIHKVPMKYSTHEMYYSADLPVYKMSTHLTYSGITSW